VLLHDHRVYRAVELDLAAGDEWPTRQGKLGRGGTSHVPCFAWVAEHASDADAVLVFSDCESDLAACPVPACPTLFFRPPHSADPPAWAAASVELPA
jgi:hypothetical protein